MKIAVGGGYLTNTIDRHTICDWIKGYIESYVADIVFEISTKKGLKLLCFILFSVLINCS